MGKASKLLELLDLKYSKEIELNKKYVYAFEEVNESGDVKTTLIPRPPTFRQSHLLSETSRAHISNFEVFPMAFYELDKLNVFVTSDCVKDYRTNPISREIIDHCLNVCPSVEYLHKLLSSAIRWNVEEVTDLLIERFGETLKRSFDYFIMYELVTKSRITGNFSHIHKLAESGIINHIKFL